MTSSGDKVCIEPECLSVVKASGYCGKHYAAAKRHGKFGHPPCLTDGCSGFGINRGYCGTCYSQKRRSGEFYTETCKVSHCENAGVQAGWCGSHYYRLQNGLDMDAPFRKAGEWQPWYKNGAGYMQRRKTLPDGTRIYQLQHRVAMEEHLGRELQAHENVHHRNGDKTDNRIDNLEIWNTSQPAGQRPEDKVAFAKEMLRLYEPEALAGE